MHGTHILVVEDDPRASLVIAGWLRNLGASVAECHSVVEAEQALMHRSFDLIVSDVHLPGNNRLEWVERILQGDLPPPVLLLTGNPELETTLRAANLPIAGYLVKPPDFSALGDLSRRLISDHRYRIELRALSQEATQLLTTDDQGAARDPLRAKLRQLSHCLAAEASRSPRSTARPGDAEAGWRIAVSETISVLEKTRHSFRSKELGQLRQRLQQMLARAA